jgi:hypothetical protein
MISLVRVPFEKKPSHQTTVVPAKGAFAARRPNSGNLEPGRLEPKLARTGLCAKLLRDVTVTHRAGRKSTLQRGRHFYAAIHWRSF